MLWKFVWHGNSDENLINMTFQKSVIVNSIFPQIKLNLQMFRLLNYILSQNHTLQFPIPAVIVHMCELRETVSDLG